MSFTISGSALASAVGTATKIVGKAPESLTLSSTKVANELRLVGAAQGKYITHTFKAESVDDQFRFGVPVDRLLSVSNKRAAMKFTLNESGSTLNYASTTGNYKGHIEALVPVPIEIPKVNREGAVQMSPYLRTALFDLFGLVSLSPMFVNREMMLFINVLENGLVRVAAADDYHMGMAEGIPTIHSSKDVEVKPENVTPEDLTLPFVYVSIITGSFDDKKGAISMATSKSHMHVFNDTTRISLPLVAVNKESPLSMAGIRKYFKGTLAAEPDSHVKVDIEAIKLCLSNMSGIKDTEKASELELKIKENSMTLRMDSKHGSVSETVLIDNVGPAQGAIRLEPNTVEDTLAHIDGKCDLLIVQGSRLIITRQRKNVTSKYFVVGVSTKAEK